MPCNDLRDLIALLGTPVNNWLGQIHDFRLALLALHLGLMGQSPAIVFSGCIQTDPGDGILSSRWRYAQEIAFMRPDWMTGGAMTAIPSLPRTKRRRAKTDKWKEMAVTFLKRWFLCAENSDECALLWVARYERDEDR
jgi:hypothetical protein